MLVLAQNGIDIGPLRGLLDNEQRKNAYLLPHLLHTIFPFFFCVILSAPTPLCPCLLPSFLLLCLSFSFSTKFVCLGTQVEVGLALLPAVKVGKVANPWIRTMNSLGQKL